MDLAVVHRAALGGAVMGVSLALRLAYLGSNEGISGMAAGLWKGAREERIERAIFLSAMVATGVVLSLFSPRAFENTTGRPLWVLAVSGFGVGLGARFANGCTSGHGVLGLARESHRSLAAVGLFMLGAWFVSQQLYPAIGGAP